MKIRLLIFFLIWHCAAIAQEVPAPSAVPIEQYERQMQGLQQEMREQQLAESRRIESVEDRLSIMIDYIDRVLVIFGLSLILVLILVIAHQRSQNRLSRERVDKAVREAQLLMDNINRELARPEMEWLRIGQFLRTKMRNFFDTGITQQDVNQIMHWLNNPNLPVSQHYMAYALVAEYQANWDDAIEALEKLRLLAAEEVFVFLHLANVYGKLAANTEIKKNQDRYSRSSNEYYVKYATALGAAGAPLTVNVAAEKPQIKPHITATVKHDKPPAATVVSKIVMPERQDIAKPTIAATVKHDKPSAATAVSKIVMPEKQDIAKPTAATVTETIATTSPAKETPFIKPVTKQSFVYKTQSASSIIPNPELSSLSSVKDNGCDTSDATALATIPEMPIQPVADSSAVVKVANGANGAAVGDVANAQLPAAPVSAEKITNTISLQFAKRWLNKDNIVNHLSKVSKVTGNIKEKVTQVVLKGGVDESLPSLPVPVISEIPQQVESEVEIRMWSHIHNGDLYVARAGNALNFRRRHQLLDKALYQYAEAQGYKTNVTLYMNWGLALLGKALHMPDKKRSLFYNSAIDKFMAGNAVQSHHFDFVLASLYAIIGQEQECQRWLEKSRDSGTLDNESLRHAPDFDGMREKEWFAEFMRH